MKPYHLIAVSCVLLSFFSNALAFDYYFRGTAKREDGTIAYYENHFVTAKEELVQKVRTVYSRMKNGKEKKFAELISEFKGNNDYIPDSVYTDDRFKTQEITRLDGDTLWIIHKDLKKNKEKKKSIKTRSNMVLGQGYHNYIIKNFDQFKTSEVRKLKFVVTAQMDYFTFKLIFKGQDAGQKKFGLQISSWVLSMFADELDVRYDLQKRLALFKGLTNIPNDEGDNEVLSISFEYDKKPPKF